MQLVLDLFGARRPAAPHRTARLLVLAALGVATVAYAGRGKVEGVTNFGRVTDNIFRGGEATSLGLENLHDMGVRTVIDLAGKSGERGTCQRLGMKYYAFPMHASERPDDAKVEEILSIMRNADQPVYVHCSAGKHRAGTITALYRLRVQGWTPEQAWKEQQSYGFGPAKDHRELYEYVYGRGGPAGKSKGSSSD
jgi:tyrosine-protein phosphatase SIW14